MSKSNSNTFNQKLIKLEEIYNSIKNVDDNDLDNLIALYKEGIQLAKELEKEIQKFEFTIQTVHSTTKNSGPEHVHENDTQKPQPHATHSTQYVADLFSGDTDDE